MCLSLLVSFHWNCLFFFYKGRNDWPQFSMCIWKQEEQEKRQIVVIVGEGGWVVGRWGLCNWSNIYSLSSGCTVYALSLDTYCIRTGPMVGLSWHVWSPRHPTVSLQERDKTPKTPGREEVPSEWRVCLALGFSGKRTPVAQNDWQRRVRVFPAEHRRGGGDRAGERNSWFSPSLSNSFYLSVLPKCTLLEKQQNKHGAAIFKKIRSPNIKIKK